MLVVPDAAPAFGDQNNSHLFKWYSDEVLAQQSMFSIAEKMWEACLTPMKYNMYCCFCPKPITYISTSMTCDLGLQTQTAFLLTNQLLYEHVMTP